MRQSFFGVPCRHIRMSLFAMVNGSIEMRDALLCMGIILCFLGRLCMFEGRLGMSHEHIRMSLFAVINGFFRMTNGLSQVILCNGKSSGPSRQRLQGQGSERKFFGSWLCSSLFPFL